MYVHYRLSMQYYTLEYASVSIDTLSYLQYSTVLKDASIASITFMYSGVPK
jgi:hypothetical protein